MAAAEIRRAIVGSIPDALRNCVNKEYFMRTSSTAAGYTEGKKASHLNWNIKIIKKWERKTLRKWDLKKKRRTETFKLIKKLQKKKKQMQEKKTTNTLRRDLKDTENS